MTKVQSQPDQTELIERLRAKLARLEVIVYDGSASWIDLFLERRKVERQLKAMGVRV